MEKEENISPELAKLDAQIMKAQEATKKLLEKRKKKAREIAARQEKEKEKWLANFNVELEKILKERYGKLFWNAVDAEELVIAFDDALPKNEVERNKGNSMEQEASEAEIASE